MTHLHQRVIPVLLLDGNGLYKTERFRAPRYLGDPINTVRIFNEKGCDELMILDITATLEQRSPAFDLLAEIASECFMPICFGGGVRTVQDCERLFGIGVEKVAINTAALTDPNLIREAAKEFGSQSVMVVADYRRTLFGQRIVYSRRGRVRTKWQVVDYARHVEQQGAGELVVQSIERDGTGKGFDLSTIRQVAEAVTIPVVGCGGAGSVEDLVAVLNTAHAAAAGSMFVFHGPHRAVLISYPNYKKMRGLLKNGRTPTVVSK
jgi:cyclase